MKFLATAVLCLAAAACATDPASATGDAESRTYRTGSNLPQRDRGEVRTMTPEEMEQMRNAARANTGRAPSN